MIALRPSAAGPVSKRFTRNVSSVRSKVVRGKLAVVDGAPTKRYRAAGEFNGGVKHTPGPTREKSLSKGHVSFALVIALAATPAVASAAAAPAPKAAAGAAQAPPTRAALSKGLDATFKAVDTNGDGSISAAEAQAAEAKVQQQRLVRVRSNVEAEFAKLDTNKDGQLSKTEFMAAAPTSVGNAPNGAAIVAQLDKNKDGKVTPDEYKAQRLAIFDKLDTNHDGTLSATERQAAQASRAR